MGFSILGKNLFGLGVYKDGQWAKELDPVILSSFYPCSPVLAHVSTAPRIPFVMEICHTGFECIGKKHCFPQNCWKEMKEGKKEGKKKGGKSSWNLNPINITLEIKHQDLCSPLQ